MGRGRRVSRLIEFLAGAGALPSDDQDERIRKATLVLTAALITAKGKGPMDTYLLVGRNGGPEGRTPA